MRVLIANGYIVYYFDVVAFKTEIYDDDTVHIFDVPHYVPHYTNAYLKGYRPSQFPKR